MSNPRHVRHDRHASEGPGASAEVIRPPRQGPKSRARDKRPSQIKAARTWARERCSAQVVHYWRTSPRGTGPGFDALWSALGIRYVLDGERQCYTLAVSEAAGGYMFRNARRCIDTYNLAVYVAKYNINQEVPLPDGLKAVVSLMLEERLQRPKAPGRSSTRNWERDYHVFRAVEHIVKEFGIRATRNDATAAEDSACDIISAAFKEAGEHGLTYKAVKAIWLSKKIRRRIEVSRDYDQARMKYDTFEPWFVQFGIPISRVFGNPR